MACRTKRDSRFFIVFEGDLVCVMPNGMEWLTFVDRGGNKTGVPTLCSCVVFHYLKT